MKKALLSQKRVVAALAVVLIVMSLLPAGFVRPISSTPHDVVMAILTPLIAPLNALAGAVRSSDDLAVKSGSDEQLQRELLAMHALLEQTRAELAQTREQLRKITLLRQQYPLSGVALMPAKVIEGAPRNESLSIDRGRRHGIDVGMAVTDGGNLVGKISRTGASRADVGPIVAQGTLLAVSIAPMGGSGFAPTVASIRADGDGRSFVGQVASRAPIEVGDLARLDDAGWPQKVQRFVVGVVVAVEKDQDDPALKNSIRIQTVRSFGRMRSVEVVMPPEALPEDYAP